MSKEKKMAKGSKSKRGKDSNKSTGKASGSKRGSAKKLGSIKATAAKKVGARKQGDKQMRAAVAAAFKGDCLGLERAAEIVLSCVTGTHQLKETLEEAGLISPDLRKTFKECVFQKVNQTCKIKDSGIPNGATVKLRDVAIAISDNAEKP